MRTKIDLGRVAASALEAALGDEPAPRHRPHGVRTIATGAALVTVVQVGRKHLPRLTKVRFLGEGLAKLEDMPNLRDIKDAMRERLAGHAHDDAEDEFEDYDDEDYDEDDDEDEDDEDQDEDEDDEQDEDQQDDDEDEPSGDSDEQDEPSGESDEEEPHGEHQGAPALDIGSARETGDGTAPDLVDALSTPRK